LALPNGSYITNGFDALGRMTSTTLKNSSHAVLNSHAYVYDDASRRTKQTRAGGDYVDYGYDQIGQLKTAYGKEPDGFQNRAFEQHGYTYDAAGNLNYRTNNQLVQTFGVNNLNALTTVSRSGTLHVAGTTTSAATNVTVNSQMAALYVDQTFAKGGFSLVDGTNTFTAIAQDNLGRSDTNTINVNLPASVNFLYDQNGNLRTNGTRIFEYDDENQLTRITEPNAWKSEFAYDGKMKMRISRDYEWHNGSWVQTNEVHRVYDRMLVLQERNSLNVPMLAYTRGKDLSGDLEGAGGIGGLLALTESSSVPYYFHCDGNGNVAYLADENQNAAARYLYDPFGDTLSATGPKAAVNRYRFSSKEWHSLSSAVYYGYRFYEPSLQRWLNCDPIAEIGFRSLRAGRARNAKPGQRDGDNYYEFVANSPVSEWDYFGLDNPGCDTGTFSGGSGQTLCQLRCCAVHDKCFFDRPGDKPCSAASWPLVLCPWSYCGRCNRAASNCMAGCSLDPTDEGPDDVDPYFCPNGSDQGRPYERWDDIPATCWENRTKPPKPAGYP
jgi:RHS repeat-associated protein